MRTDQQQQQQQQRLLVAVSTSTTNSKVNRSYGHSSRGGTDILAQEDGTSAITEVLATKLPKLPKGDDGAAVQEWIQKVNAALLLEEEERHRSSSSVAAP